MSKRMTNLPAYTHTRTPAPTMSSREIAALTAKRHDNVTVDIKKMLTELGEDVLTFEGIYLDSMNRPQTEYHLDRELTDTLLTGYSAVMRRKVIARWYELETQAAAPLAPALPATMTDVAGFIEITARMLHMSESGKLGLLHHAAKTYAPALLPALPQYAVDAPRVAGASAASSEVTKSATALLKENNATISAAYFNRLAHRAGILSPVTRKTSKGDTKAFSVVTEKGLAYGKNLCNPQSPRETQPHWYVSTFDDLLSVVSTAA